MTCNLRTTMYCNIHVRATRSADLGESLADFACTLFAAVVVRGRLTEIIVKLMYTFLTTLV